MSFGALTGIGSPIRGFLRFIMTNEDVIDLFDRVRQGATVVVLAPGQSGWTGPCASRRIEQVESFRIGDKDSDREDDLLDTFCYGIAIARGNSEGF